MTCSENLTVITALTKGFLTVLANSLFNFRVKKCFSAAKRLLLKSPNYVNYKSPRSVFHVKLFASTVIRCTIMIIIKRAKLDISGSLISISMN